MRGVGEPPTSRSGPFTAKICESHAVCTKGYGRSTQAETACLKGHFFSLVKTSQSLGSQEMHSFCFYLSSVCCGIICAQVHSHDNVSTENRLQHSITVSQDNFEIAVMLNIGRMC